MASVLPRLQTSPGHCSKSSHFAFSLKGRGARRPFSPARLEEANSTGGRRMCEVEAIRLSQLQTEWTLVRQAHQGESGAMTAAREHLLERYGRPVYRYLLGAVGDADAAAEL